MGFLLHINALYGLFGGFPKGSAILLMADPFSWTAFFTALAASAASTAAAMIATAAFAPKKKPLIRGKLSGDLYVQNAEPGAVIKKIYGGDVGDGKGFGVLTAGEVLWMSTVRKVTTSTRQSSGGKGFGGGGSQEVQDINYYVDLAIMAGYGPLDFWEVRANSEVIYSADPDLAGQIYEAENATLAGVAPVINSAAASNGKAVQLTGSALPPISGSITFNISTALGGATTIRIFYATTDNDTVGWKLNNGAVTVLNLQASGGDSTYAYVDVEVNLNGGNNTFTLLSQNGEATYFDFIRTIPHNDFRTGMLDGTVPRDDDYTQDALPVPGVPYDRPIERWNHLPPPDEFGARGGTIRAGNYAGIVFYPGNDIQEPDPTIEAAVDALYGEGSTPAFRRRGYAVLNNFSLTKFGGTIPLYLFRVSHQIIKTMDLAMQAECEASGALTGDLDFTAWAGLKIRGTFITAIQSARQLHDTLSRRFNTRIVEDEGKLIGVTLGATGAAVVIDSNDLGMIVDGEQASGDNNPLRRIDVTYPSALDLVRVTHLTFYDPSKKYERNTVSFEQIDIHSTRVAQDEIPMTLTSDEAQQMIIRESVQTMLESTERYTLALPYKYRPLIRPTKTLIVTDDGVTYNMRLTSLQSAPGNPMELMALPDDSSVYNQVLRGTGFDGDDPVVPVPAMTVGILFDSVLLFDRDETVNNGVGFYACGRKRTGAGAWGGWSLWRFRDEWTHLASSSVAAVIGVAASVLPVGQTRLFDDNPSASENHYVDIDLYDDATLESADESVVLGGANVGLLGEEVFQWKQAERRPTTEGPNRWRLTGLLRGRRGTEFAVDDHFIGERFVLITSESVIFVPIALAELDQEREYIFASDKQAITDAARIRWAWSGGTKRPAAPSVIWVHDITTSDWLVRLSPRSRLGGTILPHGGTPAGERVDLFYVEVLNAARTATLRRYPARPAGGERAVLKPAPWPGTPTTFQAPDSTAATAISGNNLYNPLPGPGYTQEESTAKAYADSVIYGQDIDVSMTLKLPNAGDTAQVGLSRESAAPSDGGQELAFFLDTAAPNKVYIYGTAALIVLLDVNWTSGDRWHLRVRNGRVELYHGFEEVPFYTYSFVPTYPCVPVFKAQFKARVENILIGGVERLEVVIPADDQVNLFGSTQNTLQVTAYQWSEYVGRGYETEVTLT
jgi:hypothetical protein